jgi:hypothetical protein
VPQPDWFKHYLKLFDTVEIIRSCCGSLASTRQCVSGQAG